MYKSSVIFCFLFLFNVSIFSQDWYSSSLLSNSKVYSITGKCTYGDYTYLLASYTGNISLGGTSILCAGTVNSVLIKLDKKNNILWYITVTSTASVALRTLSIDSNGNLYALGWFYGNSNVTIKLNNTTDLGSIGTPTHCPLLLLKINGISGSLIYNKVLSQGNSDDYLEPSYSYIDESNLIISGYFQGSDISINDQPLISSSDITLNDGFILSINKDDLTTNKLSTYVCKCVYTNSDFINRIYKSKEDDGFYFIGDVYTVPLNFDINGVTVKVPLNANKKYDFFILKTDKYFNNKWLVYSSSQSGYSKRLYSGTISNDNVLSLIGENNAPSLNFTYSDGFTNSSLGMLTNTSSSGTYDVTLLKIDKDGNLLNSKSYGTASNEYGRDIVAVNDKYAITGNFTNKLYSQTDTLTNPTSNQNGFIGLLDNNFNWLASRQINKTAGTADISKLTYNNLDMNYMIGTMYGSSATTSATATFNIKGATPYPTTLTTPVGTAKQMLIANSCPLIAISTVSTSNIIYNPSTTTTGSIALDVKGDVFRGYSYNWIKAGDASWSATTSSISNLTNGDYKVTVNYLSDQCSKSRAFSVRPAIEEIPVSNVTIGACNTNSSSFTAKARRYFPNGSLLQFSIDSINWNDGTLSVVSSDSTYSYTFSSLYAGNYSLYYRIKTKSDYIILKGSSVAIAPASMTISNLSLSVTPTGCLGQTKGEILVNASATVGTLSYSYTGAGGSYSSTNPYTGLSAGSSYNVYVKNSTGCVAHAGTVNFPAVTSSLTASASACYVSIEPTSNTAGIKLSATGGLAPYNYALEQNGTSIPSMPGMVGTFAGLSYGTTYDYVVTDVTGCSTTTTSYKIGDVGSSLFKVDVTTNNILCSDNNVRGELIATPAGGVSPYSYYFDYGTGIYGLAENIGDWGNLSSGPSGSTTYNIKVDDAAGCEVITTKTLSPVYPKPTPFYTKN